MYFLDSKKQVCHILNILNQGVVTKVAYDIPVHSVEKRHFQNLLSEVISVDKGLLINL
jgi:hypothetical protein